MPEATVDEDRDPCLAKDDIRASSTRLKRFRVNPEAEAHPVERRAKLHLRARVSATGLLHPPPNLR